MAKTGKYIYGVINSNKELFFGPYGITACEDVYTIPYRDIAIVVSDSEVIDYTHLLKDSLAKLLVSHQKVVEIIMNMEYAIIPMRLGTFGIDEGEVKSILVKGYPIIKNIFSEIVNKIEINVAVTWGDFNSVLKEVAEEKEIKEMKQRLLSNPQGINTNDQMKVGLMVKNHLGKKREEYAFDIQTSLSKVSKDVRVHELMDDKMVANFAFLIDKTKLESFDSGVEKLNTKFREKLNFRYVGPLPPYSFYTLEIKKLQFEEIDWARKKLGLQDNFATKNEIKKARQTLAVFLHPDKNPDIPGIEKEFDEVVTRAYNILWEYCQGESCSFNEEEFKENSILVKVRS